MSAVAPTRLEGWGAPGDPTLWFVAPTDPGTALMLLRDDLAPCAMACAFCPHSLTPTRPAPPSDPALRAAIVADFAARVASLAAPTLFLVSMDILEQPDLDALLDVAAAAGKRVILGTPGLALADRDRAAALAARGVTVALTVHGSTPALTTAIVGHPHAHDRIEAALRHARELGMAVQLATVVTAANVDDLDARLTHLVRDHGATTIDVRLFFPDLATAPPAWFDQFPDLARVQAALERLDAQHLSPAPRLVLGNAPLCQLDRGRLPHLDVVIPPHAPWHNTFDHPGVAVCHTCAARDRCVGLHPEYARRHAVLPVDPGRIARNLAPAPIRAAPAAPPRAASASPTRPRGRPPGEGVAPGEGLLPDAPRPRPPGVLPGAGIPRDQGTLPGAGRPRGAGTLPDAPRPSPDPARRALAPTGPPPARGRPPLPRPARPPSPAASGRREWPLRVVRASGGPVLDVAITPDGRWLAALEGGARPTVHAWDLARRQGPPRRLGRIWQAVVGADDREGTPTPAWTRPVPSGTTTIGVALDAPAFLIPEGATHLVRRDPALGRVIEDWRLSEDHPAALAVHVDTGALLVAGQGLVARTPSGCVRLLPPEVRVTAIQPVPGQRVLAVLDGAAPRLLHLDGTDRSALLPPTGPVAHAAWSRRGAWLATVADDTLTLWDLPRRAARWRRPSGTALTRVAITPDERHALCVGGDVRQAASRTLHLWNIDAAARRADLMGHAAPLTALAVSPDGRRVATGSLAGEVLLWDVGGELSGPRPTAAPGAGARSTPPRPAGSAPP